MLDFLVDALMALIVSQVRDVSPELPVRGVRRVEVTWLNAFHLGLLFARGSHSLRALVACSRPVHNLGHVGSGRT